MYVFLIFLIFIPSSASIPDVTLKIVSKYALVNTFTVSFKNNDEFQSTYNENLDVNGKLCDSSNYTSFVNDCKVKYEGYNSEWILVIEDLKYLTDVIENINTASEDSVFAIIFNSNYISTDTIIQFRRVVIPVFYTDNQTITGLKQYDVKKENLNLFIEISYTVKLSLLLIKSLFYINVFVTFVNSIIIKLLVITAFLWNKLIRENNDQSLQLQKSLTFLPYLRIFISFIFCYYIYLAFTLTDQGGKIMSHYIGVIFLTLLSVYKTFFWFIILLLAYGWIIYKETISRENLKKFVLYYIIIYILVFFDPFLDDMIREKKYFFKVSDIKNFIIYTTFTVVITIQARITYNKFNRKYIYAREFLQIYCDTLKLKMHMMRNIIILSILYTFSYIIIVVIIRVFYPDQTNNTIFTDSILKINEDIYLFYLLYLFRPRHFPLHFNLSMEDDSQTNINVFLVSLPKIEELSHTSAFGKNLTKSTANESPVIVVNPIIYSNRKELMTVNILDKISICLSNGDV